MVSVPLGPTVTSPKGGSAAQFLEVFKNVGSLAFQRIDWAINMLIKHSGLLNMLMTPPPGCGPLILL